MELSIDDLMKLQQKSTDDALRIQELENLCREEHEARLHAFIRHHLSLEASRFDKERNEGL